MSRPKHRKDQKHHKQGWVGGNPRYGKANGYQRGERATEKAKWQRQQKDS